MGFRNNAYATVWETKQGKGNYIDARISTSRKNKQTEQYETDFSGWVRLVGNAANLGLLSEKSRIKILECDVTNSYSKEKNTTYWNPVIFDAELVEGNASKPSSSVNEGGFMDIPDGLDDEVPFV